MRRIVKTNPPPQFAQWRKHRYAYERLQAPEKGELHQKLLEEQYFLCAYTGRRIDRSSSHIEHLKPKSVCQDEDAQRADGGKLREDTDYRNLVACFPSRGGDVSHGYGAPVRRHWWDPENFVSPLDRNCESRFDFTWSGDIKPRLEGHNPAIQTIKQLGLDHPGLKELRGAAIRGLVSAGRHPLSRADAERLLRQMDSPPGGRLPAYSFVLKYLLQRIVDGSG